MLHGQVNSVPDSEIRKNKDGTSYEGNLAAPAFFGAKWCLADNLLLAYFLLPLPIFLSGVFQPIYGIPAALFAVVAFLLLKPFSIDQFASLTRPQIVGLLIIVVFSTAWVSLGGAGHTFYANEIDWIPRYSVLRDLVLNDWPPRYEDFLGQEYVLRAPIGYYVVPAFISKLTGIDWADRLLLVWTWIGLVIFLAANFSGNPLRLSGAIFLFAIVSGLDIIGVLWLSDGYWPPLGSHIEWWTDRIKYSSNSTMLYWIPNHVLPGWALGAWLWRFRSDSMLFWRLPVIGASVMLWSPLVLVGFFPLLLVVLWQQKYKIPQLASKIGLQVALMASSVVLVGTYLMMSAHQIRAWAIVPTTPNQSIYSELWWEKTLLFILLEVLVFGAFAIRVSSGPILKVGLLLLCLLPFVGFGPTNDLATIGAIPAMTVMWVVLIGELLASPTQRNLSGYRRAILIALLMVGAVTPFNESYRALARKHWDPDPTIPLPVAFRGFPSHYLASSDHWFVETMHVSKAQSAHDMNWEKSKW